MSWTRLTAKKAREDMGRDAEYDFDRADIARQVADEFPDTDVLASPPPLRPGNVAADISQPSTVLEQKEEELPRTRLKRQGRGPSKRNLPVSTPVAIPEDAEYRCTNAFLKKNWEAWRKLAQPPYVPPKAEVRKSFLHYAGLKLHGLKVDWSTVDLSIAMNTISKERRHAARRELYRLRARMDGRLVEPTDPDADEKSQKMMKRLTSTQDRAPKHPRSEPKSKVSVKDGNLPSAPSVPTHVSQPVPIPASVAADTHAGEISRKGKKKVAGSPIVDTLAEEERKTKLAVKASRQDLHVDPTPPTPTGQTSGRGSNQMSAAEISLRNAPLIIQTLHLSRPPNGSAGRTTVPCATALPDSTYEFFCTIFVPEGIESIDPDTGEKEVMEAQVDLEELESGRGRHVLRNDVGILTNNESRAFALLEVNKTLKLWRADTVLPGVSFVIRHRKSVECKIDRKGIEELYSNINKSFKTAAENLPNSRAYHELMRNVFDSYVNPNNDPDIRPLVAGLDADDFTMEKLLGTKVPKTPYDVGPDFKESLSEHATLKLNSELLAMVDGPHDPAIIPSPSPSIPIDLTNAGLDDPFSPPRSQIVSVDTFVDLVQYISSPQNQGSKDQGWLSKCDLTKEDRESGMLPGKHLRGDVINVYIKERFLDRGRDKMHNMFFVNTFWFPKASELVDRYDRTSHSEKAMISIARLRRSISPKLRDGDSHGQLPAWIFDPIHGSNHWSLAIIRLH
ncbi:hypothetical protein R1sor_022416 [Riccia sorocarpa]|uniref:Ubiquitin-like protease family profile domain-containing protein n=1 Tax=Riccia sorocarpa TaxID=122646 RepID=A0ABD3GMY7_9MARC